MYHNTNHLEAIHANETQKMDASTRTYKMKFSPPTEDLLDSCVMPYSREWRYILKKYSLIKSNVRIKTNYEVGMFRITVVCKRHSKLMACVDQCPTSLHYVLIYCLLKSLQFIIIKMLQTMNRNLKTHYTMFMCSRLHMQCRPPSFQPMLFIK